MSYFVRCYDFVLPGKFGKTSPVKVLGGNTKITLKESVAAGLVVIGVVVWMHKRFDRIESLATEAWSTQNQAEWQGDYQKTGEMPNPFEIHRRAKEQGKNDAVSIAAPLANAVN